MMLGGGPINGYPPGAGGPDAGRSFSSAGPLKGATMTDTRVTALDVGWRLVSHGKIQLSVDPEGLIHFPRHLHPDDSEDFVAALAAASQVGAAQPAKPAAKAVRRSAAIGRSKSRQQQKPSTTGPTKRSR
jgi:hypothetical protein